MQTKYARVWYVDVDNNRGSDEFKFSIGFFSDVVMGTWATDIAKRNGASLDYWEEISQEEFLAATGG